MPRQGRRWNRSTRAVWKEVHDLLAYHYAHTDQAAKAVEYLTLMAAKAARNYAYAEAVTSLQEALRHAEQLSVEQRDHQVLDLVIRQGESLFLVWQPGRSW